MDDGSRVVKDRNELKKAYEDRVDEIVVTGDFAKKMKKIKVICKMTPAKLAFLGTALTVAGGGITMAPFTLGASSVISFVAITPIAATTGISVAAIIAIGSIGLTLLLAIFKEYDYIEVKKGDMNVVLKRRKNE